MGHEGRLVMLDYPGTLGVVFFIAFIIGRMSRILSRVMQAAYDRKVGDMLR
jgi:hypothetical protein